MAHKISIKVIKTKYHIKTGTVCMMMTAPEIANMMPNSFLNTL
jgi:hypothetical protein